MSDLVIDIMGQIVSRATGGESGSGRSFPQASCSTITPRRATSVTSDGVCPLFTQPWQSSRARSIHSGIIPASLGLP